MRIFIFLLFFLHLFAKSNDFNISKNYKEYLINLNKNVILFGNNALKDKHYIDFGIVGKLYDIKEKNFLLDYEENKQKLKRYLSKKYIRKQLLKTIQKIADFKTNKQLCLKDMTIGPEIDYVKVPVDIINPLGRIIYKKGEVIPSKIPNGQTLDLCFIGGKGNKITTINQINFFAKKYPKCIFLVSDFNVLELRKFFPSLEIYPSSLEQENRFNIKCYPVHIYFYSDKKIYNYYNYNRFKN